MKKGIFAVLFLTSLAFALQVIEPVSKDVKTGDVIDMGEMGPGQTVFIRIYPKVTEGGKFGHGGGYDIATPVDLPLNWIGNQSLLYGNPLHVTITAAKDAMEGEYSMNVTVRDTNVDMLPDIKIGVKIRITWNVLETSVSPETISVGPGQPARYDITITNKGTASDVFEVSSTGLKRWQFKKYVYVSPKSTKTVTYELVENEGEYYNPMITVVSTASWIIKDQKQVGFLVSSNLESEYRATSHGVIIMPVFESIVYSFIGLISNLL